MPEGLGGWLAPSGCLIVAALATLIDLKTYRIPNWLNLTGFLIALAIHGALSGLERGIGRALLGALIPFVLFAALGLRGFVGLGDAKLMGTMGAFVQYPGSIFMIPYVLVSGGVLALSYAVFRKRLGSVLTSMKNLPDKDETPKEHRIPYALAIFVGVAWSWLAKFYAPVAVF